MKYIKTLDAKDLVCPFMTTLDGSYKNITCITDKCMAWRPEEIGVGNPDRFGRYSSVKESKEHGRCLRLCG